ncbi:hypothetical protein [Spiroplasma platyhelix]|uniref:Rod shape-determining protein MreD n=1 Tax=Spiroplasma platyhelix PALS-1 TaxID=1276218 RepID=A0A846UA60_9MOLU|nr:hypothetical protein [Spiroplasma platyhelix]MBE4704381.1 hypothetical protein [Spiroplasma platyhelix PALS-1]NKE38753.1 hypothetical protein [Spiroplasma platyhelix PALS-1]UJB28964.1 hypothetical protein SPLAT_v1c01990 [Spiroplasma platyhelix PALS-1]
MYRFKSIKYLAVTGFMTALLFVVAYLSSLFFAWTISVFGGTTTLQLFDALFVPFCAIFKGPMMLFAGSIAGGIFDLVSGVRIITIPVTILIRVLMFFIIKLLTNHKWWSSFYSFFIAVVILMFGYPLYYVMIYHDRAIVISELIGDTIQAGFAYVVAVPLYYYLSRIQTNNHFWNDSQFDYLRSKQKSEFKEIYDGEENGNW